MFTIGWTVQAGIDLATAWVDATDPAAVNRAAAEVERALAADPTGHPAEHLSEGLWRLTVPPLAVFFEVNQVDPVV